MHTNKKLASYYRTCEFFIRDFRFFNVFQAILSFLKSLAWDSESEGHIVA